MLPTCFWGIALIAIGLRCITWKQALNCIPGTVMVVFAMAEALGHAMKRTETVTVIKYLALFRVLPKKKIIARFNVYYETKLFAQ